MSNSPKFLLTVLLSAAMTLIAGKASAQDNISGYVMDNEGYPVIGAAVIIDGTSTGTTTGIDGEFTLEMAEGTAITVSCIGYTEVKTTYTPGMTITMQIESTLLDDVVVVAYGVQKKETLTGAISVVKDEMLEEKGALSSPLQAMQGQIPGVIITRSSSAPGDESWGMSLRGAVSTNSSEPLVIIDGVAYESINDMRLLNPSDIESMSFLKDGAAAIYGSRAAGGVVLITTKKGKEGRAKVEYSGSYTMKTVGRMPELMTLDEWSDAVLMATADGSNVNWQRYAELAKLYKGQYIDLYHNVHPFGGEGFPDIAEFIFDDSVDYFGSLFGNAHSTSHDLSVSGGSEKISYRVSLGYLYDGSPLQYGENNNQRYNIRVNNTFHITDWLTLDSSIGYNRQEQIAPTNISSALTDQVPMPGLPLFTADGKAYGWGRNSHWTSPASELEFGGDNKLSVSALNVSEALNFTLTKWLDLNVNLGYNTTTAFRDMVSNPVTYYNYDGTVAQFTEPGTEDSYYRQTGSRTDFYSASAYLNGHHTFADDHSLSATLGAQYELKTFMRFGVQAENIQEGLTIVNGSGVVSIADNTDKYKFAVASVFGRVNYDYKEKYLVELNMRYDGSSKFLPQNRWAFFWGGSLGWRLSQEGFLQDADWLSELKLRLSYGEVGNQNGISNYDGYLLYNLNTGDGALIGNALASTITTSGKLVSLTRTWERVQNYNIGLDFGFFDDRLVGTVEAFTKRNNNMLVGIDYPSIVGDNPPSVNEGKFKSWGYEGQLTWRDRIGKDFSYSIGGTFTFARNELVDFGGAATIANGYVSNREGYPIRSLFGLRYAGKIENEEMLEAYLNKYYENNGINMPNTLRVGDNMFADVNGDGKLDYNDYVYLGPDDPEIQYSINLGLQWKGIDFSVIFQGAANRTMWNGYNSWTAPMRTLFTNTTNASVGNIWSADNPDGHYCPYSTDERVNAYNYQASSWTASDGAYIRLKNLTLGYSFPEHLLEKQKVISGCRIYFTGTDLWEYSQILDGWDPEAKSGASSTARYPFMRGFSFGVNLTF